MINTTIGNYKITRLIGEGGMACVYEGEHKMLGTKVAIKVLNPILSANTQIKERFRNEAKLMASLDHPNITKVIDFEEKPQQISIVMEFLNGEDLNQIIKRKGPLSEKEIIDIFSQTLSAFQYAHQKGIVHRDIKPSNIFILPNGVVKILDFGIAKLFGNDNEITQTGTLMGTPVYMSPEQVKADKSIDHRSDIYSLGVTMYFAVNGKAPYNSVTDSQFDIFNKIVYETLPEFTIKNKFEGLILKACEKNSENRFQSCLEYLNTLNLPLTFSSESNDITLVDDKNIRKNSFEEEYNRIAEPEEISILNKKTHRIIALFIVVIMIIFGFSYFLITEPNPQKSEEEKTSDKQGKVNSNKAEVNVGNVTGTVEAPKEEDHDKVFTVVEIPAEFPGGFPAWAKYLERNLNRDLPVDNGAPPGIYTVIVSFIVDKNGRISEVQAENDPGYGTKEEAVRVIKKGPSWKPAYLNGRNVNYRQRQSIAFMVSEE